MIGLWLMTALRNYHPEDSKNKEGLPDFNTLNIIEIGPGSGIMMSDILRVINFNPQFRLSTNSLPISKMFK